MSRSIAQSKREIASHYDVGNEFYRLFLGDEMVYSCAYFRCPESDIITAQRDKLDYICRKLRLKRGEKFLDIGCGWGALAIWAAKNFGVESYGVTLSKNQHKWAQKWIEKEEVVHLCRVELKDYREINGEGLFDKIASVGMFEHVGIKNYPEYFSAVGRLLKEKGFFLNHGIVSEEDEKKGSLATRFINTYVFPGGELDDIANVLCEMRYAGFEILDLESMRAHYVKTLRHWVRNLEEKKEEALMLAGEKVYRLWRIYMAGCGHAFERGDINVYQVLASKQLEPGLSSQPLTRADLY